MPKMNIFSFCLGLFFALGFVSSAVLFAGCPGPVNAQTSAFPVLEVGQSYYFLSNDRGASGVIAYTEPEGWIELESGTWVNLNETFSIRPIE